MQTQLLQIESLDALTLLDKLESITSEVRQIKSNFQPKEPTQFLTRSQVGEMLSVSLVTVTDWTNKGILNAYRLGNRVYYKRHEIEAALVNIKPKNGKA